jgi:hypothetical protein
MKCLSNISCSLLFLSKLPPIYVRVEAQNLTKLVVVTSFRFFNNAQLHFIYCYRFSRRVSYLYLAIIWNELWHYKPAVPFSRTGLI